jgi:hypothetical protein|tara:strand:+ start:116 stop:343 length:228 start_codon:yes stop_codon:yes gene_type:complete
MMSYWQTTAISQAIQQYCSTVFRTVLASKLFRAYGSTQIIVRRDPGCLAPLESLGLHFDLFLGHCGYFIDPGTWI